MRIVRCYAHVVHERRVPEPKLRRDPAVWLSTLGATAGVLVALVPTLYHLALQSWRTESGAHGPIVLATGVWLLVRARVTWDRSQRGRLSIAAAGLVLALSLHVYGRVTSSLGLESLGLYLAMLVVAYLLLGARNLTRTWFPFLYLGFLIAPPANYVDAATMPLKIAISEITVALLGFIGLPIANSGVIISIGNYQLFMATACSGLNSLISVTAILLFYVYLRHGSAPVRSAVLLAAILPIALTLNFIRVVLLVLLTYYGGAEIGAGFLHLFTGLGLFAVALLVIYLLDEACDRIGAFRRDDGFYACQEG